jgi:hypothetical protein
MLTARLSPSNGSNKERPSCFVSSSGKTARCEPWRSCTRPQRAGTGRMNFLFTCQTTTPPQTPTRGQKAAKPTSPRTHAPRPNIGGARRDRTDDLMLAKHALSQLSYGPNRSHHPKQEMVGLGRLELPTSRLSSARSNQLSYKPEAEPENAGPPKTA